MGWVGASASAQPQLPKRGFTVNKAVIRLGGKKYEIAELPSRKNQEWRGKLEQPFKELTTMLVKLPEMMGTNGDGETKKGDWKDMELGLQNLPQISDMLEFMVLRVAGSVDTIRELVIEYSPELEAQGDAIRESAYDSEFVKAFTEVIKLAYPFGQLIQGLNMKKAGSKAKRT